MNMMEILGDLIRRGYGEGRQSNERQMEADIQSQFRFSKKKIFKRKNSKCWAEDWEHPGEGCLYLGIWVRGHRNWGFWEEIGLYLLTALLEFRDSRLVFCHSQKPGTGKAKLASYELLV